MTIKIDNIDAKKEILSSEFHQYYFITLKQEAGANVYNNKVNVVIPFEKIMNSDSDYGLSHLINYFNKDFSNVLITESDNFNVIHQCEVYNNVLFIRLQPFTSNTIALHIMPKVYDTTDNILFFKDEFLKDEKYVNNFVSFDISNHYHRYNDEQHSPINLYFQANGEDRNPKTKPYPQFSQYDGDYSYHEYTETEGDDGPVYTWVQDEYVYTYGECTVDIRNRNVFNKQNVQINAGYRYNNSSPQNAVHYTGTKDITSTNPADRCTLIDTNFDKITENSNVIEQFEIDSNNEPVFPKNHGTGATPLNEGFSHDSGLHSDNIGKLYHKTIKYINDTMYCEEYDGSETKSMLQEWIDLDN